MQPQTCLHRLRVVACATAIAYTVGGAWQQVGNDASTARYMLLINCIHFAPKHGEARFKFSRGAILSHYGSAGLKPGATNMSPLRGAGVFN